MISRYTYGQALETSAIEQKPPVSAETLPYFTADEEARTFTYQMQPQDRVYGLGENVRGINKRGWIYRSCATDQPNHQEDILSMYSAHNFLVLEGKERFGVYVDYPGVVDFDIGYTEINTLTIRLTDWNTDIYVITGESALDIVHQFRSLIGRSYLAPRWAFGFGQSRWGYMCDQDVRQVVRGYRDNGMPLDMVYLDIDYMDHYKDFTVNGERFPDFAAFCQEMAEEKIHLVPIIDAAVKQEDGYAVYEEGLEKGYFCTFEDGSPFVGAVWPGLSVFPDVLNLEAREWFGSQYKFLLDQGIEGFWNDMNEPAIFYTEDRLENTLEALSQYKGRKLNLDEFWALLRLFENMHHSQEEYSRFWHNTPEGRIRHDRVHNLYGFNMTRAAGEAFERLSPDRRILLFSRSSFIGMHRYGGTWMGDNRSWWSHIELNLKMLPSLNMCGFLYTGADIGGFNCNATEDLVLRWMQLGIFTPLMRNHAALGTREQEAYQWTDMDGFRNILGMRYKLLPYLYSEYMKAALRGEMLFRPLAFEYPDDERAVQIEDQLMLGSSMMIAPVYTQNAAGRVVYMPESMKMYRFCKDGTVDERILWRGDYYYVEYGLSDVVFFVRSNALVPISKGGQCVEDVDFNDVEFLSFSNAGRGIYEYYKDDGMSRDPDLESSIERYLINVVGKITKL